MRSIRHLSATLQLSDTLWRDHADSREGKRVYRGRDGESGGGGGLEALRKDPRGVYVRVCRKVRKDAMRR
jgi:hypothetical protein